MERECERRRGGQSQTPKQRDKGSEREGRKRCTVEGERGTEAGEERRRGRTEDLEGEETKLEVDSGQ